jgi:hypothetical protein
VVPPFTTGVCIEIPEVPIIQTCPSCVEPLVAVPVLYEVTMEGFVPEDMVLRPDPLDFALEQLRLFADAGDEESGFAQPFFLESPQLTDLGDGRWHSPVQLAVGGVCPGDVVSYLPKLMLPAFDRAAGGNDNRDFTYPLDGPWDLTFDTVP